MAAVLALTPDSGESSFRDIHSPTPKPIETETSQSTAQDLAARSASEILRSPNLPAPEAVQRYLAAIEVLKVGDHDRVEKHWSNSENEITPDRLDRIEKARVANLGDVCGFVTDGIYAEAFQRVAQRLIAVSGLKDVGISAKLVLSSVTNAFVVQNADPRTSQWGENWDQEAAHTGSIGRSRTVFVYTKLIEEFQKFKEKKAGRELSRTLLTVSPDLKYESPEDVHKQLSTLSPESRELAEAALIQWENSRRLSEDNLAGIIGHEIQHLRQQWKSSTSVGALINRRQEEYDADDGGIWLPSLAGYNPRAAAEFAEFLCELAPKSKSLSHPAGEARALEMENRLASNDNPVPGQSRATTPFPDMPHLESRADRVISCLFGSRNEPTPLKDIAPELRDLKDVTLALYLTSQAALSHIALGMAESEKWQAHALKVAYGAGLFELQRDRQINEQIASIEEKLESYGGATTEKYPSNMTAQELALRTSLRKANSIKAQREASHTVDPLLPDEVQQLIDTHRVLDLGLPSEMTKGLGSSLADATHAYLKSKYSSSSGEVVRLPIAGSSKIDGIPTIDWGGIIQNIQEGSSIDSETRGVLLRGIACITGARELTATTINELCVRTAFFELVNGDLLRSAKDALSNGFVEFDELIPVAESLGEIEETLVDGVASTLVDRGTQCILDNTKYPQASESKLARVSIEIFGMSLFDPLNRSRYRRLPKLPGDSKKILRILEISTETAFDVSDLIDDSIAKVRRAASIFDTERDPFANHSHLFGTALSVVVKKLSSKLDVHGQARLNAIVDRFSEKFPEVRSIGVETEYLGRPASTIEERKEYHFATAIRDWNHRSKDLVDETARMELIAEIARKIEYGTGFFVVHALGIRDLSRLKRVVSESLETSPVTPLTLDELDRTIKVIHTILPGASSPGHALVDLEDLVKGKDPTVALRLRLLVRFVETWSSRNSSHQSAKRLLSEGHLREKKSLVPDLCLAFNCEPRTLLLWCAELGMLDLTPVVKELYNEEILTREDVGDIARVKFRGSDRPPHTTYSNPVGIRVHSDFDPDFDLCVLNLETLYPDHSWGVLKYSHTREAVEKFATILFDTYQWELSTLLEEIPRSSQRDLLMFEYYLKKKDSADSSREDRVAMLETMIKASSLSCYQAVQSQISCEQEMFIGFGQEALDSEFDANDQLAHYRKLRKQSRLVPADGFRMFLERSPMLYLTAELFAVKPDYFLPEELSYEGSIEHVTSLVPPCALRDFLLEQAFRREIGAWDKDSMKDAQSLEDNRQKIIANQMPMATISRQAVLQANFVAVCHHPNIAQHIQDLDIDAVRRLVDTITPFALPALCSKLHRAILPRLWESATKQERLELIDRYTPIGSTLRDEYLRRLAVEEPISISEANKLSEQLSAKARQGGVVNSTTFFGYEAIVTQLSDLPRSHRAELLLWVIGARVDPPTVVVASAGLLGVGYEETENRISTLTSSERDELTYALCLGTSGLFAPKTYEDDTIMREFLKELFERRVAPAFPMHRDLSRDIFFALFLSSPPERRTELFTSLCTQLADLERDPKAHELLAIFFGASGPVFQKASQGLRGINDELDRAIELAPKFSKRLSTFGFSRSVETTFSGDTLIREELGSASIKQTRGLSTEKGTGVCKVNLPGVERHFVADLVVASEVFKVLRNHGVHVPAYVLKEISDQLAEEGDISNETNNQETLRQSLGGHVVGQFLHEVPKTLSRGAGLLYEALAGGSQFVNVHKKDNNAYDRASRAVGLQLARGLFVNGCAHADTQDENLFLDASYDTITWIDPGAIVNAPEHSPTFSKLCFALYRGKDAQAATCIASLMGIEPDDTLRKIVSTCFLEESKIDRRVQRLSRELLDVGPLGSNLRYFLRALQTGKHHLDRAIPRVSEISQHGLGYFLAHCREAIAIYRDMKRQARVH